MKEKFITLLTFTSGLKNFGINCISIMKPTGLFRLLPTVLS